MTRARPEPPGRGIGMNNVITLHPSQRTAANSAPTRTRERPLILRPFAWGKALVEMWGLSCAEHALRALSDRELKDIGSRAWTFRAQYGRALTTSAPRIAWRPHDDHAHARPAVARAQAGAGLPLLRRRQSAVAETSPAPRIRLFGIRLC